MSGAVHALIASHQPIRSPSNHDARLLWISIHSQTGPRPLSHWEAYTETPALRLGLCLAPWLTQQLLCPSHLRGLLTHVLVQLLTFLTAIVIQTPLHSRLTGTVADVAQDGEILFQHLRQKELTMRIMARPAILLCCSTSLRRGPVLLRLIPQIDFRLPFTLLDQAGTTPIILDNGFPAPITSDTHVRKPGLILVSGFFSMEHMHPASFIPDVFTSLPLFFFYLIWHLESLFLCCVFCCYIYALVLFVPSSYPPCTSSSSHVSSARLL